MSIHVSVVGPEGRFVSGLGITDFELLVDGRVQHLTGVFEAGGDVSAPGRPPALRTETRETDPTAMRVVDNDLPTGARRHFLLVFDLTQAGPRTLGYARSAALEFLAGDVRESDMVGVAVYGPHRGLDFAVPFTSQHTAAAKWLEGFGNRSAMERLAPVGDGIDLQAIAELDAQSAEFVEEIEEIRVAMGAENMVEALTQLADALAVVEGRKHVLFFSRGLPDTLSPCVSLGSSLRNKAQGSQFGVTLVVLPDPCPLASPELIYTALTRQQDRVVLLHQGDIATVRALGNSRNSETAGRLTNLFDDPDPFTIEMRDGTRRLLDGVRVHCTDRGEVVASKSEVIVANALHAEKIEYAYEQPLDLGDGRGEVWPDFTIEDEATGEAWYVEHAGMLDDDRYRDRWEVKLSRYRKAGVLPEEEGGNLVVTSERDGIDSSALRQRFGDLFG